MNRWVWRCLFSMAVFCLSLKQTAIGSEISSLERIWPLGEIREYVFEIAGQEVGRQWNQLIEGSPADSGHSYRLLSRLSLDLNPMEQAATMNMDGRLSLTAEGRPLSYRLDVSIAGETQSLETLFSEEAVSAKISKGGQESQHTLPLSKDVFLVDNNMIGQWGVMLGLLPLKVGGKFEGRIFIPQALSEMNIQVDVRAMEAAWRGGVQEEAYVCQVAPMGEILWMTRDGSLIRLDDPKQSLVVTLISGDEIQPGESSPEGSSEDASP